MSSNKTVRLVSGGALQVRQGVLRGAGPVGPTGPSVTGPTGPTGATGPAGTIGDTGGLALLTSSVSVTVANSPLVLTFQSCAAQSGSPTNPLNMSGGTNFNVTIDGSYTAVITAIFTSGGAATGRRRIGLHPNGNATPTFFAEVACNTAGQTVVVLPIAARMLASAIWNVRAYVTGTTDTLESVSFNIVRNGIGPTGSQGPTGPTGPAVTGPTGPTGPVGGAGTGYGTYDALQTGGNSATNPADGTTTTDQAIPYPIGTGKPSSPYWFKTIAEYVERRFVARFTDDSNRTSKRSSRYAGEVTFLTADNSLWVRGASADLAVAQVRTSTSGPDAGTYPAGTLWIQV